MKEFYKLTNNSSNNFYERNFRSARKVVDTIKENPKTFATGFVVEKVVVGLVWKKKTVVACSDTRVIGHEWEVIFPRRTETPKVFYELVGFPHPDMPEIDEDGIYLGESRLVNRQITVSEFLDRCYRANKITMSLGKNDPTAVSVVYSKYLENVEIVPKKIREAGVSCFFVGGDDILIYYKEAQWGI